QAAMSRQLVPQKPHHVRALERLNRVTDEQRIQLGQIGWIAEGQVRGPFRFLGAPIVRLGCDRSGRGGELAGLRINTPEQALQLAQPVDTWLLVGELLSTREVVDVREAVIATQITDAILV